MTTLAQKLCAWRAVLTVQVACHNIVKFKVSAHLKLQLLHVDAQITLCCCLQLLHVCAQVTLCCCGRGGGYYSLVQVPHLVPQVFSALSMLCNQLCNQMIKPARCCAYRFIAVNDGWRL
jgi:hypothetical protein